MSDSTNAPTPTAAQLHGLIAELVAAERTGELLTTLVAVFEDDSAFHTERREFGVAGDFAHRAHVIREYFLA